MNKLSKTIFTFITASLFWMGLLGCTASLAASINNTPEQVSETANEIAEIDVPAGYKAVFSASLNGYTVAGFQPDDDGSHLYLIQSEHAGDYLELERALEELRPGKHDFRTRMTVIETRPMMVRGQETTLVISEGVNSKGITYRQALVVFQGNKGPALMTFSEPTTRWNQKSVDTLIASIR